MTNLACLKHITNPTIETRTAYATLTFSHSLFLRSELKERKRNAKKAGRKGQKKRIGGRKR